MIEPAARLAQAEIDAIAARERLSTTLATLQLRLNPKRLARLAMRDIADKGTVAAAAGVDGARRNPGTIAGVTALAGLYLARHRIAYLVRRRDKPRRQTKAEPALLP
jgi:hypothetical protein